MGPLRELTQTHRSDIQQTGRGMSGGKKSLHKATSKKERGKERSENSEQAHTNKQAVLCPGSCDGCILNGPLRHKQAAHSLIAGPQGLESPERLCALQRQRYLHEAPRGHFIKKKKNPNRYLMIFVQDPVLMYRVYCND